MTDRRIGIRVEVMVSDPWDFVTAHGAGPFFGKITHVETAAVLVHMDVPLQDANRAYEYVVAVSRLEVDDLADLAVRGACVGCNLVGISAEAAQAESPCDLSNWRGGLALIAGIRSVSS